MYYKANGNMLITCAVCGRVKVDDPNVKFFAVDKIAGKRVWLCETCKAKREITERGTRTGNSDVTMIFTPSYDRYGNRISIINDKEN